jgi:hypothetical protein
VTLVVQVAAVAALAVNALAAAGAGVAWLRWSPARPAWLLVRAGQVAAGALAVVAGVALVAGFSPRDGLFWLYAVLPVVISFVAEQLKVASAETVLEQYDLEDAKAVGRLPAEQQRGVVLAILRREVGVMAVAAAVIAFLALRALNEI